MVLVGASSFFCIDRLFQQNLHSYDDAERYSADRMFGNKCWSGAHLWTLNNGSRTLLRELWEFTGIYWHFGISSWNSPSQKSHHGWNAARSHTNLLTKQHLIPRGNRSAFVLKSSKQNDRSQISVAFSQLAQASRATAHNLLSQQARQTDLLG